MFAFPFRGIFLLQCIKSPDYHWPFKFTNRTITCPSAVTPHHPSFNRVATDILSMSSITSSVPTPSFSSIFFRWAGGGEGGGGEGGGNRIIKINAPPPSLRGSTSCCQTRHIFIHHLSPPAFPSRSSASYPPSPSHHRWGGVLPPPLSSMTECVTTGGYCQTLAHWLPPPG